MSGPWVLGISGSHNGSYCLLHGDEVRVAVQEERLTGVKRARVGAGRPALALRYCLDAAGIDVADLSMIVTSSQGPAGAVENDPTLNPDLRSVRHVPTRVVPHHLAHAASAVASSGFERAAVLVIDGLGSPVADWRELASGVVVGPHDGWEHLSLFTAEGACITPIELHTVEGGRWLEKHDDRMWDFFTLGGMFAAAAHQVFGDASEAGKVMGLAAYGNATIPAADLVAVKGGRLVFPNVVQRRYRAGARWPQAERANADLAASVQRALEEVVVAVATRLRQRTGATRLCYAGGVALNSIANEAILRRAGFDEVHVIPAAEDSGVALGAAHLGLWELTGRRRPRPIRSDGHGRTYGAGDVDRALAAAPGTRAATPDDLLGEVVDRLVAGQLGGWFRGGAELGPRALGHRSIICSPIGRDVKAELNGRVKFREQFRPFAPAVLLEAAADWFDFGSTTCDSPHMLRVVPFRPERAHLVPAVVHHDGTGRLQTLTAEEDGEFHELVRRFGVRTGVPILLNTSLNVRGEPIAERPEDALWCLLGTGLDFCVVHDRLVTKEPWSTTILDLVPEVVAEGCVVPVALGDGSLSLRSDGDHTALLRTVTAWGPADVPLPARLLLVLSAIDGRLDGHELQRSLGGEARPEDVVRDLLLLRRMGAVVLRGRACDVQRR